MRGRREPGEIQGASPSRVEAIDEARIEARRLARGAAQRVDKRDIGGPEGGRAVVGAVLDGELAHGRHERAQAVARQAREEVVDGLRGVFGEVERVAGGRGGRAMVAGLRLARAGRGRGDAGY